MWAGQKPNRSKLRVLGCKVVYHIGKSQRGGKFALVAFQSVLVNYQTSNNCYRVWDPTRAKVYYVGEPTFDEAFENQLLAGDDCHGQTTTATRATSTTPSSSLPQSDHSNRCCLCISLTALHRFSTTTPSATTLTQLLRRLLQHRQC